MIPPLRLPKDVMFCPGCLKLMPKQLWDALITRNITCTTTEPICFRKLFQYSSSPKLYEVTREKLYPRNQYGIEVKTSDA